jgi:cell filamentation protein
MTSKVQPGGVEPEYIKGSTTLVNKLGITDTSTLISRETDITAITSLEIMLNPLVITPYTFDFKHLKSIHKYLFGHIYTWAGMPRSYDFAKSGNIFTPANEFTKHEATVFAPSIDLFHLSKTSTISKDHIVDAITKSLGLINMFHPFPDGNGRAQRIFIFSLSKELGYLSDFNKVSNWEMVETCKQVHQGNYEPMHNMIDRILVATY